MTKEPIYWEGTVTEVQFPNRGKMIPAVEESAADTFISAPASIHVKNVLPGQKVKVQVGRSGKRRREGRLIQILEQAPYETAPRCPHAAFCGGCSYQTVPYEIQLQWKARQIHDLLDPVLTGSDCVWEDIVPSPLQEGYRNKMEFSFGDEIKGGPLTLGLHKRGAFHDIITTDHCRIVHPDFQAILQETLRVFTALNTSHYNSYTHEGYLRHLVLRRSFHDESLLVNLVTTGSPAPVISAVSCIRPMTGMPMSCRMMRWRSFTEKRL